VNWYYLPLDAYLYLGLAEKVYRANKRGYTTLKIVGSSLGSQIYPAISHKGARILSLAYAIILHFFGQKKLETLI